MAPSTNEIITMASAYHTYQFEMETSWWSGGVVDSNCGEVTVLKATGTTVIESTHTLDIHWQVRIMMSIWWFGGTSNTVTIQLTTAANGNLGSATVTPSGVAYFSGATYNPYCTNSQASNFDQNFTDNTASVKVRVASTAGSNWGLR